MATDQASPGMGRAGDVVPWVSIGAAIAAITAVGIALGLGLPLLSVILERRGVSASMIGLNSAMAGLASIAIAPLTTRIAARLGVANAMLIALVVAATSAMGFYAAPSLAWWFALRVTFHGAITVLFILSEYWINAAAPPARRGMVLGIYATVLSLGFAAGPWLFSILGSEGFTPFAVGAAIMLSAAIPIVAARGESPAITVAEKGSFLRYVMLVPTATAAVFVFGAVESGGLALFPVYATRAGYTEGDGALLLTMIGLGNVVFQIPIGLMADRSRDKRTLLCLFGAIGLAGALALPFLIEDWWPTALVLLVWGGCVAGLYTVGLTHLGSRLHGGDLAAANAAFVFCYALGMLAGPQTIGATMDLAGRHGFAFALALFFGLYLVFVIGRMVALPKPA